MIIKIFSKKWNYNVALSLKKMLTHYNINSIIVITSDKCYKNPSIKKKSWKSYGAFCCSVPQTALT